MKLPKESRAQEIGREAEIIFLSNTPLNWIMSEIKKDNGLDYSVEVKNKEGDIAYNFYVQLKSTKDNNRIKDKYITVKLKSSTLNYYQNNTSLVLIVVCDINIKECYFGYSHIILKEMLGNKRYFDDNQKEYTIKIFKSQKLDKSLNIEHLLEDYVRENHTNKSKLAIKNEYNIRTFLEDNKEDYKTKRLVDNNTFTYQKGRVYLNANLPNNYDLSISMLIIFKIVDAEKAMITPSKVTILKMLFSGYKSKASSSVRKWIINKYNDNFFIQIGDTRLNVPVEVIEDFSEILDDLFEVYYNRIKSIEDTLKMGLFQPSSRYYNGYRLIQINRQLWYEIHQFAKLHRFRDGHTKWHIFGYDKYSLKIHCKDQPFIWFGNINISAEPIDYANLQLIDDKVILVWNSLPYEKNERINIDMKILNIEDTYKWLVEELIPKVIYEFGNKNIEQKWYDKILRINRKITYEDFSKKFDISKYVIRNYRYKNAKCYQYDKKLYLYETVIELQTFYNNEENIFVDIESLTNLYEGIVILLENGETIDFSYIYGNLSNIKTREYTKDSLIREIKNYIDELSKSTTNNFMIDLILRCYFALVEDNKEKFDEILINKVFDKLKLAIDLKDKLEIRKKMLSKL